MFCYKQWCFHYKSIHERQWVWKKHISLQLLTKSLVYLTDFWPWKLFATCRLFGCVNPPGNKSLRAVCNSNKAVRPKKTNLKRCADWPWASETAAGPVPRPEEQPCGRGPTSLRAHGTGLPGCGGGHRRGRPGSGCVRAHRCSGPRWGPGATEMKIEGC